MVAGRKRVNTAGPRLLSMRTYTPCSLQTWIPGGSQDSLLGLGAVPTLFKQCGLHLIPACLLGMWSFHTCQAESAHVTSPNENRGTKSLTCFPSCAGSIKHICVSTGFLQPLPLCLSLCWRCSAPSHCNQPQPAVQLHAESSQSSPSITNLRVVLGLPTQLPKTQRWPQQYNQKSRA